MSFFTKPAETIDEQITRLVERGLIIEDEQQARHYLANISYFRLSAYARPFYTPNLPEHQFLPETRFKDILRLYVFDRELRLLLLDAIERIEVALRAQLTNTLAEHHDPHGYLNAQIFDDRYDHQWLLNKLTKEGNQRVVESYLEHYLNKYTSAPIQPPIWMAVELLTFKEISTLFSHLKDPKDTQRIEAHFGWKFPLLKSWFRSLSDLRNLCAHHARVWNREFGSRPEIPKKIRQLWPNVPDSIAVGEVQTLNPRRRLYLQIVVIEALMKAINPESGWSIRLMQLIERYPSVSLTHMGFVPGWQNEPFWQHSVKEAAL
jgi:abortive infection bacteriophage resistance protein